MTSSRVASLKREVGHDDAGLGVDRLDRRELVAWATTSKSGSWSMSARRPSRKMV